MAETLAQKDIDTFRTIVADMEAAWNAGDGAAFAKHFSQQADFVTVRAEFHHGKSAIAAGHQGILDSIYKGSTNTYVVKSVRVLSPDIAMVYVEATLECPAGPLAGTNTALFSMVVQKIDDRWQIVSFHNTLAPRNR